MENSDKFESSAEEYRKLKEQNEFLQKKVAELQTERDAYLRHIHSLARENVSEEVVRGWLAEEKVEGSLLDFINEWKKQV